MENATLDPLPAPLTGTLDDLMAAGDTADTAYKVFVGHNLGQRVFLLQVPMHQFFQVSEVANNPEQVGDDGIAQRRLDSAHAHKLAVYILKGLVESAIEHRAATGKPELPALASILETMGRQPYMSLQPLVANLRTASQRGRKIRAERVLSKSDASTACFNVYLSQRDILWVIDGQHRRWAMKMVFDFLEAVLRTGSYPRKGSLFVGESSEVDPDFAKAWQAVYESARAFTTVSAEVHLGLEPEQERQLFHDLNNLGKRVDKNLALKFDRSNPINLFIKDVLHEALGMKIIEKDVKDWNDDEGALALKDVVAINAILFLNKTNIGGATPSIVEERKETAKAFWEAIDAIPNFGEEHAKEKTIAAQPVVLKALAKLVFDFKFNSRRPDNGQELADKLLDGITDIDFSHENPMWRYYEMSDSERQAAGLHGLAAYLPAVEGGNRDIGSFQNGLMRFGAKHNDIYPILGDMVRWKLGLPSRHAE